MNPVWGSRAWGGEQICTLAEGAWNVEKATINVVGVSTGETGMRLHLPFGALLVRGPIVYSDIVVWIDSDPTWQRVGSFAAAGLTANSKVYTLSPDGELQFGNGDYEAPLGKVPAAGAQIGFSFKEEELLPTASSPYTCQLKLATDGEKKNIHIFRIEPIREYGRIVPTPGARIHRMPVQFITIFGVNHAIPPF